MNGPICVTPSLDCRLAATCARHFRKHGEATHPDQTYCAYHGDNAVFACPGFIPEEGKTNELR